MTQKERFKQDFQDFLPFFNPKQFKLPIKAKVIQYNGKIMGKYGPRPSFIIEVNGDKFVWTTNLRIAYQLVDLLDKNKPNIEIYIENGKTRVRSLDEA